MTTNDLTSHCYPAGTMIKIPGGQIEIQNSECGASIVGFDIDQLKEVGSKILRLEEFDDEPILVCLTLEDGDTLQASPSQRILCGAQWLRIGEIAVGQTVGDRVVVGLERIDWPHSVFTLVTEKPNSYIVVTARGNDIVSHDNSSDPGNPPGF